MGLIFDVCILFVWWEVAVIHDYLLHMFYSISSAKVNPRCMLSLSD